MTTSTAVMAQKQDYYWPLGRDQGEELGVQATAFDFNTRPFAPAIREGGLEFDQLNAAICNTDGHLLFYSNGCAVANREQAIMMNGDSINAGLFFEERWRPDCAYGYPGRQDIIILPDPEHEEGYYIIHKPLHLDSITGDTWVRDILFTYIDMSLDRGYGVVKKKNVSFYSGDVYSSYLTSIAHTNGHDWWILNPAIKEDGYLTYWLSEKGIEALPTQKIGAKLGPRYTSAAGDAKFSPDGKQYALYNVYDGLRLFDFDRTTGQLSDAKHLSGNMPETTTFASCEWSPDSRFLYLIQRDSIWQLDTQEIVLEDGMEFIAEYNGVRDPLSTAFFTSTLGPDCRIYIRAVSSTNSFHVIHKPNEKGQACDLVQQGLRLPYITGAGSFPNFPRFRVDEEEKCDPSILSIAGETVYWRREMTVYPNPASDLITVELPETMLGTVFILNMDGLIVQQLPGVSGTIQTTVAELFAGIYSVEFVPEKNKDRVVYTRRLVVVD